MTIGGSNTLTILGGLTVTGGTASHTISASRSTRCGADVDGQRQWNAGGERADQRQCGLHQGRRRHVAAFRLEYF